MIDHATDIYFTLILYLFSLYQVLLTELQHEPTAVAAHCHKKLILLHQSQKDIDHAFFYLS